eukprot:jgi/Chrzof1/9366/Cz04g00060.t1
MPHNHVTSHMIHPKLGTSHSSFMLPVERSARSTFPDLHNFRPGRVVGFRRVFAHTADIFWARGIAKADTKEMSSLSCEPYAGHEVVVSLFEVPYNPEAVAAFINREHEFRLVAVRPTTLEGTPLDRLAVLCAKYTDAEYKARRCPSAEYERRWGKHGISRIWHDDLLPCRVYLRHCVLAAQGFCAEAYGSFLDATYLSDRCTTVRQYLQQHPDIMTESPPHELADRYSG